MNSSYKVIFNKARGALMVVNEITSSVQGKGTKTVIAADTLATADAMAEKNSFGQSVLPFVKSVSIGLLAAGVISLSGSALAATGKIYYDSQTFNADIVKQDNNPNDSTTRAGIQFIIYKKANMETFVNKNVDVSVTQLNPKRNKQIYGIFTSAYPKVAADYTTKVNLGSIGRIRVGLGPPLTF